mgnify:CR=1 FL=1
MSKQYETVIGLEVHVELATRTKIFCGCSTAFGGAPNTHTCPVCTGQPGALPVLNRAVVETMHTEDRGVKTRSYPDQPGVDYYGVLRAAAASGCRTAMLIEHGFHTNPEDAAFLTDEDCLERLANAEADVLLEML